MGSGNSHEIEGLISRLSGLQLDPTREGYSVDDIADVVEKLFVALGTEDLAAVIEDAVRQGALTVAAGAQVLGVAEWCGTRGGAEQVATLHRWLRDASDPVRLGLALGQDWYPFSTDKEMRAALSDIARRFPELGARCSELIAKRGGKD
jgi:hypothetical protein